MIKAPLDGKRYREIRDAAGRVLVEHSDGRMPIVPRELLQHMGDARCVPFTEYRERMGLSSELTAKDFFASQDACTALQKETGLYIVVYNDDDRARSVPGRLRWTLAHELGHIALGHLQTMGQSLYLQEEDAEGEYTHFEQEADCFAAMLLAYPALVKACNIPSVGVLQAFCGLSKPAATSRFVAIQRSAMSLSPVDELVLKHFEQVIWERNLPFVTEIDFSVYGR